jgi:hypothetical protein
MKSKAVKQPEVKTETKIVITSDPFYFILNISDADVKMNNNVKDTISRTNLDMMDGDGRCSCGEVGASELLL